MRLSPKKIGIVGPGALGGMIGLLLHRAGYEVNALARPEKAASIRRRGITLTSGGETVTERLVATADPADIGPQDLLIVTVKYDGLAWAVPQLQALSHPQTQWVFVMNGVPWWFFDHFGGKLQGTKLAAVDPHGALAEQVSSERLVWGVINCSVDLKADGALHHNHSKNIILGRADGSMTSLPEIATVFGAAGFKTEATARIHDAIWGKLLVNIVFNPLTALTQATSDLVMGDPLVRELAIKVTDEGRAVGEALGLPVGPSGEERYPASASRMRQKTSMLLDVERGRPLETGPMLGAVIEIADHVGVPVPYARALHGLLRVRAQAAALG